MRRLADLSGVGPAMLDDFDVLGIKSVEQLARCDADQLYKKLCDRTGKRQDPCVLDVFNCAIAQARDPDLPREQRNWWYWSRLRKGAKG
jgi:nucleotidyltransferase/DNA polymerase involved in DNA repair